LAAKGTLVRAILTTCAAVLAVLAIVLGLVHLAVRPTKDELSAAAIASFDLALTELRSRIAARRAALAG
jgi:hypothetical protein